MSPSSGPAALDATAENSAAPEASQGAVLDPTDTFVRRHLGSSPGEVRQMLETVGLGSVEELVRETVPESIRRTAPLALAGLPERELGERELLESLRRIAEKNRVFRSYLGMGYSGTTTPGVMPGNILENPGWYTQYTPYQSEISQGRLEALLNFQTLVEDLTGLPIANASLLDEGTAAAEAMHLCHAVADDDQRNAFFVARDCHPQTIAVVQTRAGALGIEVRVGDPATVDFSGGDLFGVLLQYPATDGRVADYAPLAERAHAAGALVVVAADLLALTLLRPPGDFGADVAVGSAQRFGVPMGYGGPHAAFLATREAYKRQLPGRVIGVSRDRHGRVAYRMAMQTREQHIRREKATAADVDELLAIFGIFGGGTPDLKAVELAEKIDLALAAPHARTSAYLTHPVFNSFHTEHEMLRYIKRLEARDLSMATSMIPLGSCTMKLNATSEMVPVTWPELGAIHPFAPAGQTAGYQELFRTLEQWLCEITGFAACSLQPNAGSQGEYAGLMVLRAHHHARGDGHRDV